MDAVERWAAAHGCVNVEVTSLRSRDDAHRLLRRAGLRGPVRGVRPVQAGAGARAWSLTHSAVTSASPAVMSSSVV